MVPPSPESRVTLHQIAESCGVHLSTVARALKDDPRISQATRTKVQALATELGYFPDPMMSALCAYRKSQKPASFHGTLAWITNFSTADGWCGGAYKYYFNGAVKRAEEYGYRLNHFWLGEKDMTAKRASSILYNSGVSGLLICPLQKNSGHLDLDWDKFSAVKFGYTMIRPDLHSVTSNHFRATFDTVRQVRALGYRRIGYMIWKETDVRLQYQWTAGYTIGAQILPQSAEIPIFRCESESLGPDQSLVKAWIETYRPDAIICPLGFYYRLIKMGYKFPEQMGVACCNLQPDEPLITAGMEEQSLLAGKAAVDFLVGMVQRGERGVPKIPQQILVGGTWHDGKTLRKQNG